MCVYIYIYCVCARIVISPKWWPCNDLCTPGLCWWWLRGWKTASTLIRPKEVSHFWTSHFWNECPWFINIHHDSMIIPTFGPFQALSNVNCLSNPFQKDSRFQNDCAPNLKLEDARTTREAKHRIRIARVLQVSRLMRCNRFAPWPGTASNGGFGDHILSRWLHQHQKA